MNRTVPETVFEYAGSADNVESYSIALTSLSQDDRGFVARISVRLPQWEASVSNYFLGWSLNRFLEDIKTMHTSPQQRASLFSFDDELELLVAPSARRSGAIAVKLLCGESFRADCFVKESERDSRKKPRLVLDSGFIELDRSYLETLSRDIHAFLAATTFSREHPSRASAAK
jgi:hypothetical protein